MNQPYFQRDGITLYHGDCRDVMPSLPKIDLVLTDPPFGARRPSSWRSSEAGGWNPDAQFDEIEGNESVDPEWLKAAFEITSDDGAIYSFCSWDTLELWRNGIADAGYRVRSCIVWDKMIHGLADPSTCWAPRHEMILFGVKGRHELRGKRPVDVLRFQRVNVADLLHPYQKPAALIKELLRTNGGIVLDPFAGSGTTLRAAMDLGRKAIGVEISETYCEVAAKRLEQKNLQFAEAL